MIAHARLNTTSSESVGVFPSYLILHVHHVHWHALQRRCECWIMLRQVEQVSCGVHTSCTSTRTIVHMRSVQRNAHKWDCITHTCILPMTMTPHKLKQLIIHPYMTTKRAFRYAHIQTYAHSVYANLRRSLRGQRAPTGLALLPSSNGRQHLPRGVCPALLRRASWIWFTPYVHTHL